MTLTITLNTTSDSPSGVNFDTYLANYFATLVPTGWPYILGGASNFDGSQIVLLDKVATTPANTKAIVLDGSNIKYDFAGHTLSGTLTTVRLSTLGGSYNSDGSFDRDTSGRITGVSTAIEISGLSISNASGVRGDMHNTVNGLMGSGHDGGLSNPTVLKGFIWAEAHNVVGSAGHDVYNGTKFNDTVRGNAGDDRLSGGLGNDTIDGGIGNDTLNGGTGNDRLTGGAGNDIYYVDSTGDVVVEVAGQGTDTVISSISLTLAANVENLTLTGSALVGTGNTLNNVITGNALANTLNGGTGTDRLVGGAGNDTYVTDGGDVIVEAANGGTDTVRSSVNYTLGSYLENLTLTGAALVGTGNTLNNVITGNALANTLNGGGGADRLVGGAGNDIYVTDGGDTIVEAANGGTDTVQSSANHTLAANVENLTLTGSALVGVGNTLNNVITGNALANTLNGGTGADRLVGGAGNDTYYVDNARDAVVEAGSQGADRVISTVNHTLAANVEYLTLTGTAISGTGNTLANVIVGTAGNNLLAGGLGNDTLTGGAGSDSFLFNTALNRTTNVDRISDFNVAADTIRLDNAVFKGLADGWLAASAFHTGTAAADAQDRVIYNKTTGAISYDADGSGSGTAVHFATVSAGLALTNADFFVV